MAKQSEQESVHLTERAAPSELPKPQRADGGFDRKVSGRGSLQVVRQVFRKWVDKGDTLVRTPSNMMWSDATAWMIDASEQV